MEHFLVSLSGIMSGLSFGALLSLADDNEIGTKYWIIWTFYAIAFTVLTIVL